MNLKETLTTPGTKHNLQFPRALREQFERDCGFTDDEWETLTLRGAGRSLVEIASIQHCSVETVSRRIRTIKHKIAEVI